MVELLCKVPSCALDLRNNIGSIPFFYSVDNTKIVRELLRHQQRFDINTPNNEGYTALHVAVIRNNIDAVRLILDAGGDLNIRTTEDDDTALMSAITCEDKKIFDMIIRQYASKINIDDVNANNENLLHYAARAGNAQAAQLLCQYTNVNFTLPNTCCGHNPFMIAIIEGHMSVVQELLKYLSRFNINYQDVRSNSTALHLAIRHDRTEMIELICSRVPNLDLTLENHAGDTPIQMAARAGNFSILRDLVRYKKEQNK